MPGIGLEQLTNSVLNEPYTSDEDFELEEESSGPPGESHQEILDYIQGTDINGQHSYGQPVVPRVTNGQPGLGSTPFAQSQVNDLFAMIQN